MEARATREGGVRTALASQNVTDNEMGGKRREREEREIAERGGKRRTPPAVGSPKELMPNMGKP